MAAKGECIPEEPHSQGSAEVPTYAAQPNDLSQDTLGTCKGISENKLGNSYDRDGIDEVASAGHFQHKNLNH